MSIRHSLSEYLTSIGLEPESDPASSISQPLLSDEEPDENNVVVLDDDSGTVNVPPKKVFHGSIKVKSVKSDNSTDESTEFDEEILMYQQFPRRITTEEDPLDILQEHQCLSPTKPSSRALIYMIYAIDFTFGSFLITRCLLQMRNEYGNLIALLVLGLLLVSGSIAGMCLHTPLRKLFEANDGGSGKRSLFVFNVAFGFIAFGVYYVLSLLLLTSTQTMEPFVGYELGLCAQFIVSIVGFTLSVAEVYRVMYLQFHFHADEAQAHSRNSNRPTPQMTAESNVESAESIPSVLFV